MLQGTLIKVCGLLGAIHINPGQWTTPGNDCPWASVTSRSQIDFLSWRNVAPSQLHFSGASSTSSSHYGSIWISLIFTQVVTENRFQNKFTYFLCFLWRFIGKFILSINNEHMQDHSCPGAIFLMDKSYLGKVGYPVLYNGPCNPPLEVAPGQQKTHVNSYKSQGKVLCQPLNSPPVHPLGDLFLCHPSLGRVNFVLTIQFSIIWRVIFWATI